MFLNRSLLHKCLALPNKTTGPRASSAASVNRQSTRFSEGMHSVRILFLLITRRINNKTYKGSGVSALICLHVHILIFSLCRFLLLTHECINIVSSFLQLHPTGSEAKVESASTSEMSCQGWCRSRASICFRPARPSYCRTVSSAATSSSATPEKTASALRKNYRWNASRGLLSETRITFFFPSFIWGTGVR